MKIAKILVSTRCTMDIRGQQLKGRREHSLRWRVQTADECDDEGDESGVGEQQEGNEVEWPPVCRAGRLLSHRRRRRAVSTQQQRNTDAGEVGLTGRSEQLRAIDLVHVHFEPIWSRRLLRQSPSSTRHHPPRTFSSQKKREEFHRF
jgi:hypothetical protein